jgi:hypothetical protein
MTNDTLKTPNNRHLFWTGITGKERFQAIQEIEVCVGHYGFITEFNQFSDLDMNLCIEVDTDKLDKLFDALQSIIQLDDDKSEVNLDMTTQMVYLHLSFLKGQGNLTIEVPAVPG